MKRLSFIAAACLVVIAGIVLWREKEHRWRSNLPSAVLNIDASTSDEQIRKLLLDRTPLGTEATNVLKFAVDELAPKTGAAAESRYVDALQPGRTNPLPVVPIGETDTFARGVYLILGSYSDNMLMDCDVTATWMFDDLDKLTNIVVRRTLVRP